MNNIVLFENYIPDGNFNPDNEFEIGYRGTDVDEALKAATLGHLPFFSSDSIPQDEEVLRLCIPGYRNMSREEQDEEIEYLVTWTNQKGVNLTDDLINATGYGECVIEVAIEGECADFGKGYYFAKKPDECRVQRIQWEKQWYTPEDFINSQ